MKIQACIALFVSIMFVSIAFGQDAWTDHMRLANQLQQHGKYSDARKLYEGLLAEASVGSPHHAEAFNNLAAHFYELGEYQNAEPLYERAIKEWRELGQSGRIGVTLSNLATLYRKTGRYRQAIETFPEAERNIVDAYGGDSPQAVSCLVNWAEAYRAAGQLQAAEATAAKALERSERILTDTDPRLSHSLHAYAMALQALGRGTDTAALHTRALAIREKAYGPEHTYVAATLTALASLNLEQGHYADAEPLAARALHIWERRLGSDHLNTAFALNNLAQSYRLQDRYAEAEPLYQRAIEILNRSRNPEAAKLMANVGDLYLQTGRVAAAIAMLQRSGALVKAFFGDTDSQTLEIQRRLAQAYEVAGRKTEAAKLHREVDRTDAGRTSPKPSFPSNTLK